MQIRITFCVFALISMIVTTGVLGSEISTCELNVDCETGTWGLDSEIIAEVGIPKLSTTVDQSIIFDRRYRRAHQSVQLYDAPNGQVVSEIKKGFNFFTMMSEENGWTQVAPDRWISSSLLTTDVTTSLFSGVHLSEDDLEYPLAWVLVNLYPSRYPGGDPSETNDKIWRYTMVHIFSTVEVDNWNWYQIGIDQWVKQTQVAKILPVEMPDEVNTNRWMSIDLYEQVLIAYEDKTPVFATLISSGMADWETNEGVFDIYLRFNRTLMTGGGEEDFYYLQEVPWTMYFDGDIALHGAYWHDGFGYRRSHGCVNISVMDAYTLYHWSSVEFDPDDPDDTGASVYVYSSGEYE